MAMAAKSTVNVGHILAASVCLARLAAREIKLIMGTGELGQTDKGGNVDENGKIWGDDPQVGLVKDILSLCHIKSI